MLDSLLFVLESFWKVLPFRDSMKTERSGKKGGTLCIYSLSSLVLFFLFGRFLFRVGAQIDHNADQGDQREHADEDFSEYSSFFSLNSVKKLKITFGVGSSFISSR